MSLVIFVCYFGMLCSSKGLGGLGLGFLCKKDTEGGV